MTSQSSFISSSSALRYVAVFAVAAFAVIAVASGLSYVGYRYGIVDFTVYDLYRYQQAKLKSAGPADVVFVGDSSLGNSIDAAYWSEIAGRPALNLALAGSFGYPGYYNMLRQAIAATRPRAVVIMATMETMTREVPYRSYIITTSFEDAVNVVPPAAFIETYVNGETAWRTLRGAFKNMMGTRRSRISDDYITQRAPMADPESEVITFEPHQIRMQQREFLRAIAELCRVESLTCVYAHGPIHDAYCQNARAYIGAASEAVESAGLKVIQKTPICVPAAEVGDSPDHVRPRFKHEYTRKYYDLLASDLGLDRRLAGVPSP